MKKIIALISVLVFITVSFCSCTGPGEDTSVAAENSGEQSSNLSNEEASAESSGEASEESFKYATGDFAGTTVKILTVDSSRHTYGELQFVPNEDFESNAINEAVKERNNYIYDNYGITITVRAEKYPSDVIYSEIMADTADYDIVCESVDRMVTKVSDSLFISLDNYIDVNDEWWDQRSLENLSLDGKKHFFVSGDCMLTDVDNIYLTLYNKDIYSQNTDITNKYGDIYQLVKDHKFTLDVFIEMSKAVSVADVDGNWTFNATYGNLSHAYGATIMVNGGGVSTVVKDSDSGLRCAVLDEKAQSVFQKVYELMSNRQITERAELIIGEGSNPSNWGFSELQEMFVNGRGLFYNTTVASISILKSDTAERDFDFGVLPIPLYDETQDEYYCAVNRYQSSVLGIPISNTENVEAAVFLLNALGYLNTHLTGNVMNAYYEITLKLQGSDTQDDCDMLDLIFDSKFYDLGTIFTWGNLSGIYGSVINNANSNTLVSTFDSYQDGIEQAINETYQTYINSLL